MTDLVMRKTVAFIIILAFLLNNGAVPSRLACAQEAFQLPPPGVHVHVSQTVVPPLLKGVKLYPQDPLKFDFILDKGDSNASTEGLRTEATRLIKYFLASITVPEKDLWVNLSPYEKDRIVPDEFGVTEMGRDLLAQDYILKQLTASVLYPEGESGKKVWAEVYQKVFDKYGTTDIPIDMFNKVWIVPEKAVVYEKRQARADKDQAQGAVAYVVDARLKVLLDSDYLAADRSAAVTQGLKESSSETQEIARQVIREIILPVLEKEVNEGQNFARLRQVYYSLILAAWYKRKIKGSFLSAVYSDQNKVQGVNIADPGMSKKIWAQYVETFKKGVYSCIREESDPLTDERISRKYFSGGLMMGGFPITEASAMMVPATSEDVLVSAKIIRPEDLSPEAQDLLGLKPRAVAVSDDALHRVHWVIAEMLHEQMRQILGSSGTVRIVNTGSTVRGTHIFDMGNKNLDMDFSVLFNDVADIEKIRSDALRREWERDGLKARFEGMGLNKAGMPKLNYSVFSDEGMIKLEVSLGKEQKIYRDWFNVQMDQIYNLGGYSEIVRADIRRIKKLFYQWGMYKTYESGMGAVGIEQLVIQSAGAQERGRQLEGVGGLYQALKNITAAGVKGRNGFHVYDPETGEDFVERLSDENWQMMVRLAQEALAERERIETANLQAQKGDYFGVQENAGPEYARAWSPETVTNDSVKEYIERGREWGSGHFMLTTFMPERLRAILADGYLMSRFGLSVQPESLQDEAKQSDSDNLPTTFVHAVGDRSDFFYNAGKVGFFAWAEPLMENKCITGFPGRRMFSEHNNLIIPGEWELSGFSEALLDDSNKFNVNELGMIFVPKDHEDDQSFQGFLKTLSYTPRIYYYTGGSLPEGVAGFLKTYHVQRRGQPKISGQLGKMLNQIAGVDVFFNDSPWRKDQTASSMPYSITAEHLALMALRRNHLEVRNSLGGTDVLAREALRLAPESTVANLAGALVLGFSIDHFEKVVQASGVQVPRAFLTQAFSQLLWRYQKLAQFAKARWLVQRAQEERVPYYLGGADWDSEAYALDVMEAMYEKVQGAVTLSDLERLIEKDDRKQFLQKELKGFDKGEAIFKWLERHSYIFVSGEHVWIDSAVIKNDKGLLEQAYPDEARAVVDVLDRGLRMVSFGDGFLLWGGVVAAVDSGIDHLLRKEMAEAIRVFQESEATREAREVCLESFEVIMERGRVISEKLTRGRSRVEDEQYRAAFWAEIHSVELKVERDRRQAAYRRDLKDTLQYLNKNLNGERVIIADDIEPYFQAAGNGISRLKSMGGSVDDMLAFYRALLRQGINWQKKGSLHYARVDRTPSPPLWRRLAAKVLRRGGEPETSSVELWTRAFEQGLEEGSREVDLRAISVLREMASVAQASDIQGGIDFKPVDKALGASSRYTTPEIAFDIDPALLARYRSAPGFAPVITGILQNVNLHSFLGIF